MRERAGHEAGAAWALGPGRPHWLTAGSTDPALNSFLSPARGWGPCFQQLASPPRQWHGFKGMKSPSGNEMMWILAQLRSRGFSSLVCWASLGKAQPHPETLSHAGVVVRPSTCTLLREFWTCVHGGSTGQLPHGPAPSSAGCHPQLMSAERIPQAFCRAQTFPFPD